LNVSRVFPCAVFSQGIMHSVLMHTVHVGLLRPRNENMLQYAAVLLMQTA